MRRCYGGCSRRVYKAAVCLSTGDTRLRPSGTEPPPTQPATMNQPRPPNTALTCTQCVHTRVSAHAHTIRLFFMVPYRTYMCHEVDTPAPRTTRTRILITHPCTHLVCVWGRHPRPSPTHNPKIAQQKTEPPQPRTSKEPRPYKRPTPQPAQPATGSPRNRLTPQPAQTAPPLSSLHSNHRVIARLRFSRCVDPRP